MHDLNFSFAETHADERTVVPVYDPTTLDDACRRALSTAREQVQELAKLPPELVSVKSVLDRWNEIEVAIEDVFGPAWLLNEVHPSESVREVAKERIVDLSAFTVEIYQSRALYEIISAVEPVTEVEMMLKKDLLESFEDGGVALEDSSRRRYRELTHSITELSQQFAKNIREQATKVPFTMNDIDGIPVTIIDTMDRDGDDVLVDLGHSTYNTFMMNVHSADSRRRLFTTYLKRGGEENLRILDEIVSLRNEIARLFGRATFAHFALRRRMAENPERVDCFLDEVMEAIRDREQSEIEELRRAKAAATGQPLGLTTIYSWDVSYWSERVREKKFSVNQEELRKHFPVEASIRWIFELSTRLYGIRFERIDIPVWAPDVLYFDVIEDDSNSFIGGIYLDLYPRLGKFKLAGVCPVRGASRRLERKPVAALLMNCDRRGLSHRELEFFLHEFGHVLHAVLSSTQFNAHTGTSAKRDFVEAPSQMFEQWGRRLESLSIMNEVCSECPQIDADLVERLDAARRFGKGIHYARQHLYASYDMALSRGGPGHSLDRWKQMEEQTSLGYAEGTMFPAGFGHITGEYAAGYYGYLWSEAIANDLLSIFGDDVMDRNVGRRFRDLILAPGAEMSPKRLVEKFLGRPVSSQAFIKELRDSTVRSRF